jgi:hypothetical protein
VDRWHNCRHGGQTFIDQFVVSWVEYPKAQHQDLRSHEVRNSKKVGSSVVGLTLITCHNFDILAYRWIGGRDFCPESLEIAIRSNEEFGISALQVSGYKGGSTSGSKVAKCRS